MDGDPPESEAGDDALVLARTVGGAEGGFDDARGDRLEPGDDGFLPVVELKFQFAFSEGGG